MGKRTIELLNRLSDALDGASDYEVAGHLDVTRATVSKWRTGHGSMSDETALRAARLLGEDEDVVLLEMAAERASSDLAANAYRHIAGRLKKSAAVVLFGLTGFLGFSHPPTAEAHVDNCILRQIRRRVLVPA